MENAFLDSAIKQFRYYEMLGRKTIDRLSDDQIMWRPNEESNSVAVIVNHLHGNMISRWTDFLTTDGEKAFRKRDQEFEDVLKSKEDVINKWEEGWSCLHASLSPLNYSDLNKIIYIRNQGHEVVEAINRQLCHYAYHVGQIVFMGRLILGDSWESLSIPKHKSTQYNKEKFAKKKSNVHFTKEYLDNTK